MVCVMKHEVVFLFDVDNTLLDHDRVGADLKRHLTNTVGAERQARYWTIFEELRANLGTPTTSALSSAIALRIPATHICSPYLNFS